MVSLQLKPLKWRSLQHQPDKPIDLYSVIVVQYLGILVHIKFLFYRLQICGYTFSIYCKQNKTSDRDVRNINTIYSIHNMPTLP